MPVSLIVQLDQAQLNLLNQRIADVRERYVEILTPVFCPQLREGDDPLNYYASLLRILGMEDAGWDPYSESRALLHDLNRLLYAKLPEQAFSDASATRWRLGLLHYGHIVEMDAPYDVLVNLLRFQLQQGYSPYPFISLPNSAGQMHVGKTRVSVSRKIKTISRMSQQLGYRVGEIFDDFYVPQLRNAVAHADYILARDSFRCRGGLGGEGSFRIPYTELSERMACAIAFTSAFFDLELFVRRDLGSREGVLPYHMRYKGLLEFLVDDHGAMCGFAVHWPNGFVSLYSRTETGVEMVNCSVDSGRAAIRFMVGTHAKDPGGFSPLVEADATPTYSPLHRGGKRPTWPS